MRFVTPKFVRMAALCFLALFAAIGSLRADEPKKSTSLKVVPATAAFYGTSLRHKEILEQITASKAYKRMVEHKVFADLIAKGTGGYEANLKGFKEGNPQMWAAMRGFYEEGLTLLGDMMSQECFWYGGKGWVDSTPRMQAISNKFNALVSQFAQLSDEERNAKFLEVLDDSEFQKLLGDLRTPETVLGFRISNNQLADDYLAVVAAGIKQGLASSPDSAPFAKMYKKETLAGGAFHVFTLDLSLLTPELMAKIGDASGDSGEQVVKVISKLKTTLKNLKLVISLGRIDDYVIVSVANDNQHLANWGKGKLLVDSPEFAPLLKAGDKEFTDIGFVSKAMAGVGSNPAAIEGQMAQIRQMRDQLAKLSASGELPITEASIKKITDMSLEDMAKLQKFAEAQMNPRASLSFTYDADEGYETMSYSFGEDQSLSAAEPLSILSHVGKAPILFAAGRGKPSKDANESIAYVAHRILELVDAVEFGDDEEGKKMQELFDKAAEKGKPIVEKFVKITTEKIIPSLSDGQTAFVLDASLTTDRLNPTLPPAEHELALPELAIVLGVSDAAKLREGLKEYLGLGRDLISGIREVSPESIPEGVTLPDPQVSKEGEGELASYAIPTEEEIVGKILFPTLGLGEDVAVLALHRSTAKRLMEESELEAVAEGLEETLEKPLAGAAQFDFNRLMDVAEGYLAYAAQMGVFEQAAQAGSPYSADEMQEQTTLVLDFLRCYERTTSVTYVENGATVTKSISVYSDYEEEKEEKK